MTNGNKDGIIKSENETEENSSSTYRKEKVNIMAKKNINNQNEVAKKAENTKEVKNMAKAAEEKTMELEVITEEQLDNMISEGYEMLDSEDETQVVLKKGRKKVTYKVKEWQKTKQVHTPQDRDIKIDSCKVGEIGVKIIYHRMKDGEKQFRIFIAEKVDGKLKRTRLVNDDIKAIQSDEKKMVAYYQRITKGAAELKKVYKSA